MNKLKELTLEFDFESVITPTTLEKIPHIVWANKLFLIGCYRVDTKKQLDWILSQSTSKRDKLYNVRLSRGRDGFVDILDPSVLHPAYLVLYEFGHTAQYRTFEIRENHVRTEEEMALMGYQEPKGSYLVYTLGREILVEGIDLVKTIQRKKNNTINWKEGTPIYQIGKKLDSALNNNDSIIQNIVCSDNVAQRPNQNISLTTKSCDLEHCDYRDLVNQLLLENVQVDLVLTDPPYCVSRDYQLGFSNMGRSGMNYGNWDYNFNQKDWINRCAPLVRDGGAMVIFNDWKNMSYIVEALEANGFVIKDLIRWEKSNPMPRNVDSRYVMDFEVALWAVKGKGKWTFNRPQNVPYLRPVFRTSTLKGHRIHPTQKSLEVFEELVRIHSNPGDLVLDPFSGSATTGVACVRNNRRFVGCEIETEYYVKAKERLCL